MGTSTAMTGFVLKSGDNKAFLAALEAIYPVEAIGPILIVDDEAQMRTAYQALVENALPRKTLSPLLFLL